MVLPSESAAEFQTLCFLTSQVRERDMPLAASYSEGNPDLDEQFIRHQLQRKMLYGILEFQEDPPGLLSGHVSVPSTEAHGEKLNSMFSRVLHTLIPLFCGRVLGWMMHRLCSQPCKFLEHQRWNPLRWKHSCLVPYKASVKERSCGCSVEAKVLSPKEFLI